MNWTRFAVVVGLGAGGAGVGYFLASPATPAALVGILFVVSNLISGAMQSYMPKKEGGS